MGYRRDYCGISIGRFSFAQKDYTKIIEDIKRVIKSCIEEDEEEDYRYFASYLFDEELVKQLEAKISKKSKYNDGKSMYLIDHMNTSENAKEFTEFLKKESIGLEIMGKDKENPDYIIETHKVMEGAVEKLFKSGLYRKILREEFFKTNYGIEVEEKVQEILQDTTGYMSPRLYPGEVFGFCVGRDVMEGKEVGDYYDQSEESFGYTLAELMEVYSYNDFIGFHEG